MWMQIIFIYFITKNDKTLNKDCSVLTDFKQVHLLVFFWPFYLHLLFFISLFQTIVYFPVMSFVICLFFKCQTHIKDTPFACFYTFFWCKVWCGLHHSAWYGIPRWNWWAHFPTFKQHVKKKTRERKSYIIHSKWSFVLFHICCYIKHFLKSQGIMSQKPRLQTALYAQFQADLSPLAPLWCQWEGIFRYFRYNT